MNEPTASIGNVFHAVFEKWALEGLAPNEPLSAESIIEAFQRIGLEPTSEILEVFTVLNGFGDDNVDDEFNQFWAMPKIIDEYEQGSDLISFADYTIDTFRYALQPAPVYADYGGVAKVRIAESFADFFQKYLNGPASVLG